MLDSQAFVLSGYCTGLGVDYTLRAGDRGGGGEEDDGWRISWHLVHPIYLIFF